MLEHLCRVQCYAEYSVQGDTLLRGLLALFCRYFYWRAPRENLIEVRSAT